MTSDQAESILSQILGRAAKINHLDQIRHPGTGVVFRISVLGHPDYILKSYPPELRPDPGSTEFWRTETNNLANIEPITTIRKPRYFGRYRNYFLQEFVDGELFEHALTSGRLQTDEQQSLFRLALDELVNIHTAALQVPDRRRLRRPFQSGHLARGLHKSIWRIEHDGLPAYEHRGFTVNTRWRQAIQKFPHAAVIEGLATTNSYVLGHGDYKPNNLVITLDRRIAVIDWLGMGKAQPWYDLAYLLNSALPAHRPDHQAYYLQSMQSRGSLSKVTLGAAIRLADIGAIYQELTRARSNSRYIGTRTDPHHINEFTAALDGLARLILDSPRTT